MTPGHVRQGRPERAGRLRPADAAHHRRHARRHGMTTATATELAPARHLDRRPGPPGRRPRGLRHPRHRHRGPRLRGRGRVAHLGGLVRRRHPRPPRCRRPDASGQPCRFRLGRLARPRRHRGHARRRPRQRPLRHPRPRPRLRQPRRRRRRRARPVGRRRRRHADGEEGRPGARARARHPGRRPPCPPGRPRPITRDSRAEVALASTTGISSYRRRTSAFLSVDAIAGEGADTPDRHRLQRRTRPR